jgi:hypothetical protein
MGDFFKLIFTLAGGGAAGAIISHLLRRRSERVQVIPLIERVNRLIDPDAQGYVLARAKGKGRDRELQEVYRVREYQFTLRNTSTVHLHDAEIQFEFPTEDVEAWIDRPVRSKTTPIPVDARVTGEWKKGFRWRIPEFPSSDSIEFTFRAVNPPYSKNEYEVALYNSPQVVIEKTNREPSENRRFAAFLRGNGPFATFVILAICLAVFEIVAMVASPTGDKSTAVNTAGCSLYVEASSAHVDLNLLKLILQFGQGGPYHIVTSVLNTGSQKCFVQFEGQTGPSKPVDPGSSDYLEFYTDDRPKLVPRTLVFGLTGPTSKTVVNVYWGQPL